MTVIPIIIFAAFAVPFFIDSYFEIIGLHSSDPAYVLPEILNRNWSLTSDTELMLEKWKNGELDRDEFHKGVAYAVAEVSKDLEWLQTYDPPNEWEESRQLCLQALEEYKAYLENVVEYLEYTSGTKVDIGHAQLLLDEALYRLGTGDDLVERSWNALPYSKMDKGF